jgi:hypothetical protein
MFSGTGRHERSWRRFLATAVEAWRARRVARAAREQGPQREPRLSRSRAGAALEARLAVRAGVRLQDFLRHRLARYATRLPVTLEELPIRIDVQDGEPVVLARPARAALDATLPSRSSGERWLHALEAREGPAAAREVRDLEAGLAALDGRAEEARARAAKVSEQLAADLASGSLPAAAAVNATPEQLGRPPVALAAPAQLLRAFALALLVAETWRIADPVLAASGLATADLAAAAARAPVPVALGLVFALGAAASVFACLGAAVARVHALADRPAAPHRRAALLAVVAAGAALATAVVAAGALPDRAGEQVLLLAVPLAAVLMVRHARRLEAERAVGVAAALAWDRARAAEAVVRAQRAEALARAEEMVRAIEAERVALRRRLRALESRASTAARAAEEAARRDTRRLDRLAEGLAAALELDRYAYLRRAAARAHSQLAPAPTPNRPQRLEPTVGSERLGVA